MWLKDPRQDDKLVTYLWQCSILTKLAIINLLLPLPSLDYHNETLENKAIGSGYPTPTALQGFSTVLLTRWAVSALEKIRKHKERCGRQDKMSCNQGKLLSAKDKSSTQEEKMFIMTIRHTQVQHPPEEVTRLLFTAHGRGLSVRPVQQLELSKKHKHREQQFAQREDGCTLLQLSRARSVMHQSQVLNAMAGHHLRGS